jgi:hypothetical protein
MLSKTINKERKYIGDLKGNIKKEGRVQRRVATAGASLGWYRGQHLAHFEDYKILRKKFPEAANYLLKYYGMNKRGEIVL